MICAGYSATITSRLEGYGEMALPVIRRQILSRSIFYTGTTGFLANGTANSANNLTFPDGRSTQLPSLLNVRK